MVPQDSSFHPSRRQSVPPRPHSPAGLHLWQNRLQPSSPAPGRRSLCPREEGGGYVLRALEQGISALSTGGRHREKELLVGEVGQDER